MATYASIAGLDPDAVAAFILMGLHAERVLAGVVSATEEDITREAGDTVQVAVLGAATIGTQNTPGGALAASDTAVTSPSVTLQKHFARENVPAEVWEDEKAFDEADLLENHAAGLAEKCDQDVLDALAAATPGATETLATKGDYTDIYQQIVESKAALKTLKVKPDYLIANSDVEAALLQTTDQGVVNRSIALNAEGGVEMVAGLKCIFHPNMTGSAGDATVNLVHAFVIDSKRALVEAWGRRPDVKYDYDIDADVHNYLTTIRYNAAALDETAIGTVANAAV